MRPRATLLYCCLLAPCSAPVLAEPAIPLYISELAPFYYQTEGRQTGVIYELVAEMARRSGTEVRIIPVPFRRSAAQLQHRSEALGALWREPRSEQRYCWIAKLIDESLVLVTRAKSGAGPMTMSAAQHLRLGVVMGSPAEAAAIDHSFSDIEFAASPESNLLKLQRGRIDAWMAVPGVIAAARQRVGLDADELSISEPVGTVSMYLGAPITAAPDKIGRWRQAYLAMKADGSYQRILRRYHYREPAATSAAPDASEKNSLCSGVATSLR